MSRHIVHLAECEPEQHPSWRKVENREAVQLGAEHCPETEYMAQELFGNEEVWLETQPTSTGQQ